MGEVPLILWHFGDSRDFLSNPNRRRLRTDQLSLSLLDDFYMKCYGRILAFSFNFETKHQNNVYIELRCYKMNFWVIRDNGEFLSKFDYISKLVSYFFREYQSFAWAKVTEFIILVSSQRKNALLISAD